MNLDNMIPVYEIHLPEYTIDPKPNFSAVGRKLDKFFEAHFPNRWVAVRGISLHDHPGRSLDDFIATIIKLGTDRYDPDRKGVHHHIDKEFGIELHATPMIVKDSLYCPHYSGGRLSTGSIFGEGLLDFYDGAIVDRGYPLRLDILMIYDLDQLVAAPMVWKENGPVRSLDPISAQDTTVFRFKHPQEKQKALIGIIKIL